MTQDIALFRAITARMAYDNQRQKVLSQNVANADTPSYKASDLKKVDFSTMLGRLAGPSAKLQPVATNEMHLSSVANTLKGKSENQRVSYEIAPGGNGVDLEEQMVKETGNTMDYNLMTSLYEKNMTMMRTALDKQ